MKWLIALFLTSVAPLGSAGAAELIAIPGGSFIMGDAAGDDNEAPTRVTVKPFRLMRTEVTNRSFAAFVKATGHVTDREREGWGWIWSASAAPAMRSKP